MEILPMTAIDITPGTTGLMNLWFQADRIVHVRDHLCGFEAYQLVTVSNYSDFLMWISPGACIRLFNPCLGVVTVDHVWTMDPSQWLSTTGTILWLLLMCSLSMCIFFGSVFGATIVKLIWRRVSMAMKEEQKIDTIAPSAPHELQVIHVSPQYT